MTLADIGTKITNLTGADTTAHPTSDRLIDINLWYHKLSTMIKASQDGWDFQDFNRSSGEAQLVKDLVKDQQNYDLALSDDILAVKRVEISYDLVRWSKVEPFDLGQKADATDTSSIAQDFNESSPFYALRGNALWLYPIPGTARSNALKIWVQLDIVDFTSTDIDTNPGTTKPGFDEAFHMMLAYGAAYEYLLANGPEEILARVKDELIEWEQRLKQHYGDKVQDSPITLTDGLPDYS